MAEKTFKVEPRDCNITRAAWAAHEAHDLYPTMREVQALCRELLPGARIRKHLLWRYSIVWRKPGVM